MLLRCIGAELQKCRRAPVWLAFLALPLFPAILGTGNYLANLGALDNGWYSLWGQHTLFSSLFFLPALLGVFCAWQWRLESVGRNFNGFLCAPAPIRDLFLAKLILAGAVCLMTQAWVGALYLLSGRAVGLTQAPPPELPGWLLYGAAGAVTVCGAQLFFSLAIRPFAPPVAIGLVGGILGLLVTSQGLGYAFPYSLLCLGMRANNPLLELDALPFLLSALAYTAFFSTLSIRLLRRRDAATE